MSDEREVVLLPETAAQRRLRKAREVARSIKDDCATDAAALDSTPFTPRGMGETFGATLAMIAGLARVVEVLVEEVSELRRAENGA